MFIDKRKITVIVTTAVFVLAIVLVIISLTVDKKDKNPEVENNNVATAEQNIDTEKLELEFKQDFSNPENEYIKLRQKFEASKPGKYDVTAYIPEIAVKGNKATSLNKEIFKLAQDIINKTGYSNQYAKYFMEYESFVNGNILSIVIRFTIKEGSNPLRIVVKTYNYNMTGDRLIKISEVLNSEQKIAVQTKIANKIKSSNEMAQKIIEQGYNAHIRDTGDEMYRIENATEFFIGKDNILYVVYAYGNNSHTDEMDLIMYKL